MRVLLQIILLRTPLFSQISQQQKASVLIGDRSAG